jgi:hypothetical protein
MTKPLIPPGSTISFSSVQHQLFLHTIAAVGDLFQQLQQQTELRPSSSLPSSDGYHAVSFPVTAPYKK